MFSVDLRSLEKQKEPRLPIGAGAFISDERPRGEAALPRQTDSGGPCRQRLPSKTARRTLTLGNFHGFVVRHPRAPGAVERR